MDYVCNRCLFSIPSKVEMAEEQEYLPKFLFIVVRIAVLIAIIISIFQNMTSFTPILNEELGQGKLIAALNSRK